MLLVGFCDVEVKLAGPVQFHVVTLPFADPCKFNVPPEQIEVLAAPAITEEGIAFTVILFVEELFPHTLDAVTI